MSREPSPPEATLADFVPMQDGRTRLLVRRGWEDAAEHLSDPDQIHAEEVVAGGREAHPVATLPNGSRVVVRRYRRGGMVRLVNRGLYFGGNRAFDELRAAERARAGGVRTPVVVAAIERPARLAGYRAWLATVLLSGGLNLAAWLAAEADEERRSTVLREAGRQTALMHAAGVAHADLNLRNLLVMPGGDEVYLLDFDKATVSATPVSPARRERDLRRLARSARKLEAGLGPEHWAAFREGYGEDWPPGVDLAKVPKEERGKDG
ncbi:MAG TPA: lipopolysaccharide kinase InaA family protein [Longimicrobium sp.]|nr:lipopolysaccharide kinase InaA family protein [Longimicrobium sp.]